MKNEKGLFIKDPNFWRVPRKIKKQIPKDTFYCYTATSDFKLLDNGKWGYTIKTCPFYDWEKFKNMNPKPSWIDDEFLEEFGEKEHGWCRLVKCEIEDQCKSCGLKLVI